VTYVTGLQEMFIRYRQRGSHKRPDPPVDATGRDCHNAVGWARRDQSTNAADCARVGVVLHP